MSSTSFSYEEKWFKDLLKTSNELKKVDFKTITHRELILYSQEYVDLLFEYLNMNKKELGSFSMIKNDMVFNPTTYDEFINYYHKKVDSSKTIVELKKKPPHKYIGFYRLPEEKKGFVYIEKYPDLISELAHFALHQVGYYLEKIPDQLVSELFDGTMVMNFGQMSNHFNDRLNEIHRNVDVYNCLTDNIKNLIDKMQPKEYVDKIKRIKDHPWFCLEFKKNIENDMCKIKSCLNRKKVKIPSCKNIPEEDIVTYLISSNIIPAISLIIGLVGKLTVAR